MRTTARQYLGLEPNIVVMLIVLLILGMGEELWTRFIPKYLEVLGAGVWIIAAYGTLKDFLDAVYQYPGGWLADRLGPRRALLLFTSLAAFGYAIYFATSTWFFFLAGTLLVMAWSSLTLPAIFSIIGANLPSRQRAIGFGVQSILKRIPIIIAPVLGGSLIVRFGFVRGMKIGFLITIALALITIFVLLKFYRSEETTSDSTLRFGQIWSGMNIGLKRLLVADCLARWAEGIPKVFIVLYTMDVLKAGAVQFGTLTSIQMLAAIVVYIPLAKLSDQMNRKPIVLLTFCFFALFPLMLVQAKQHWFLILAFITAGLREVGEPARKALIVDLALPNARARTIGLYYLIRGLVVFPASLVGGWLWSYGKALPFYVAFIAGVAGCVWYALWGRDVR